MDNNKAKDILKIWLILFIILTVFNIINTFNPTILPNIFSIGTYPLEITSMILFVYVYGKGEKNIAKFGIAAILIFFILNLLYKFNIYSLELNLSIKDKLLGSLYYLNNNLISIFRYLALFSLLKSPNSLIENLKKVSITCLSIYTLINLIINLVTPANIVLIRNIMYSFNYISSWALYTAIILYLLAKNNSNSSSNTHTNNKIQRQQPINNTIQNPMSSQTTSISQNQSQPPIDKL